MSLYLSGLRHEYRRSRLRKENADPDPINVFTAWLDDAVQAQLHEPNAMTLATATPDGRPSARLHDRRRCLVSGGGPLANLCRAA